MGFISVKRLKGGLPGKVVRVGALIGSDVSMIKMRNPEILLELQANLIQTMFKW